MATRRRETLTARDGVDHARLAREGVGTLSYTLIVLASILVVIAISAKFRTQWDATALRAHSLSPQTLDVLRGLDDEVEIRALFTAKEPNRQAFLDLLDLFGRASNRLDIEFIDPIARPGAVRDLGVDLDQAGARRDGVTVIRRGRRVMIIRETSEEAVTNGILEAGSATKKVVGIIRGYGEAEPESKADTGFSNAVEALRAEYYEVRNLDLSQPIPDDLTVGLVVGPRQRIPQEELDRLASWVASGGRLLALLEPYDESGMNDMIARFGVRLGEAQVLEPQENQNRTMEFVRVANYTKHPIVRGFGRNLPTAFPIVGTVSHFEPGDQSVFHDALLMSSRFAVGLATDGSREQGPFALAAASWKRVPAETEGREREQRVVLVADSSFASNAYLPLLANANFFLNCVGWLTESEGLVSIRKLSLGGQTILLTGRDRLAMYATLFGPALLVVLSGLVVFARRRGL